MEPSRHEDEPDELAQIYAARFDQLGDIRAVLWRVLVDEYFQQFVKPSDTVLDLAAGYCEFINAVACRKKIVVDLNPTVKEKADPDVEVHLGPSSSLPESLTGSVDVVFVSNFFEHLGDKREFLSTLAEIRRVLRRGGRLLVVQPNLRLTKGSYWDFIDHTIPITDRSLVEALELTGFAIDLVKVRFLPYTTFSFLPISPFLIKLYLRLPPAQLLFGKQSFVLARKP